MKIYEIDDIKPGEKRLFSPSNSDPNRSFSKFLSDCSEMISVCKEANQFLFRGVDEAPAIFLGRSRDNRRTLDTDISLSTAIDSIMKYQGLTAIRSNSIFCTGKANNANNYGKLYCIFPVNGFSFTWSPEVRDLTSYLSDRSIYDPMDLYKVGAIINNQSPEMQTCQSFAHQLFELSRSELYSANRFEVYKDYERAQFTPNKTNPIYDIIRALNSIIHNTKSALGFTPELLNGFNKDEFLKAVSIATANEVEIDSNLANATIKLYEMKVAKGMNKESTELNMKDIADGLEYQNTELAKAIKSNHEIMIHGEYYAFDLQRYGNKLYGIFL